MSRATSTAATDTFSPQAVQARCAPFDVRLHYDMALENGIQFGPSFQIIEQMWRQDGEALAMIRLPAAPRAQADRYQIHPVMLDACFQTLAGALPDYGEQFDTYLPIFCESLQLHYQPGDMVWSHAQLQPGTEAGQDTIIGDIQAYSADGQRVLDIRGLRFKRASTEALRRIVEHQAGQTSDDWFYEVGWEPVAGAPVTQTAPGTWLIFADHSGIGDELAAQLGEQGHEYAIIEPGEAYQIIDERRATIDAANPQDYHRLLADCAANGPYDGIIYLWALDTAPLDEAHPAAAQLIGSGSALHLMQALASRPAETASALWLITRGAQPAAGDPPTAPEQAPLWGLANTALIEQPELRYICVDLDPAQDTTALGAQLMRELKTEPTEDRIALRDTVRYAPRLVPAQAIDDSAEHPVTLTIAERGVLDNLRTVPMNRTAPRSGEVEVRVRVTGLNFRDVLNALDMYPGDPGPLGDEFVGEIAQLGPGVSGFQVGDVVLGVAPAAFSSYLVVPDTHITHKPDAMRDEEAATIPITFMTAYYALHHLAQISAGDRVLIHAGAGGVGMAAVQIAQAVGAEIFATAGSPEKRAFLRELGVPHVMDSRSLDFADEIMAITNGAGVNVVLNSLAGDFIASSFAVLADDGYFLEIGKTGIWSAEEVRQYNPTLHYEVIYLGDVLSNKPQLTRALLQDLMQHFAAGRLYPLPYRVFPLQEAASAFRFMAQARHIGKLVIRHPGTATTSIHPDATYLITGGYGGIGLHIAEWLVDQGARHLVLTGRRAPDAAAQTTLARLEAAGAQVTIARSDVGDADAVADLLAGIERDLPPLRGIIHAAGTLEDGILQHQGWDRFMKVLNPKLNGTWNLYRHAFDQPLDFLVLFSAGAALLGSPGQSNYTAANAFLDSFAYTCRAQGLPALSINWGAWAGTGMLVNLDSVNRWAQEGIGALTPDQGVAAFAKALRSQQPAQIAILPMNWTAFARSARMRPFFAAVTAANAAPTEPVPTTPDLLRRWQETAPNRRRRLLLETIHEEVIHVLGLRAGTPIAPRQPLSELGLDSLMAVELRNTLINLVGNSLPTTLLFDYPTSDALADYLIANVLPSAEAEPAPSPTASAVDDGTLDELQQMSDTDAEALLLAELDKLKKGENNG
jgi:NADPH:quinone reductase-like Zn-dependent oxidoreductase/acyl carrier protein